VGAVALLISRTAPFRLRNGLLGATLALVYLAGAVLAGLHARKVRRAPARLLSVALGLYALDRLHFAGFSLWATDLSRPYASWTALADFAVQSLVAVAMILFLLDAEQAELQQTVQRLAESEERFRLIFEHSGVGMTLLGRDGRMLQVNPALTRMLGYTAEELRGRRMNEFVHARDASQGASPVVSPSDGETPSFYEREKRYVRKDGESIWARVLRVPVRDAEGRTHHYVGVLMDITSRKQAEDRLAASEQRLRLLNQV